MDELGKGSRFARGTAFHNGCATGCEPEERGGSGASLADRGTGGGFVAADGFGAGGVSGDGFDDGRSPDPFLDEAFSMRCSPDLPTALTSPTRWSHSTRGAGPAAIRAFLATSSSAPT